MFTSAITKLGSKAILYLFVTVLILIFGNAVRHELKVSGAKDIQVQQAERRAETEHRFHEFSISNRELYEQDVIDLEAEIHAEQEKPLGGLFGKMEGEQCDPACILQ